MYIRDDNHELYTDHYHRLRMELIQYVLNCSDKIFRQPD